MGEGWLTELCAWGGHQSDSYHTDELSLPCLLLATGLELISTGTFTEKGYWIGLMGAVCV